MLFYRASTTWVTTWNGTISTEADGLPQRVPKGRYQLYIRCENPHRRNLFAVNLIFCFPPAFFFTKSFAYGWWSLGRGDVWDLSFTIYHIPRLKSLAPLIYKTMVFVIGTLLDAFMNLSQPPLWDSMIPRALFWILAPKYIIDFDVPGTCYC